MDTTVNIQILCRLCGSKTQELQRIHMFDITGVLLDLKEKIKFCLGIDINENDNLPEVICSDCVDKVDNFSNFKRDAEKTTDLLQGLLNQQADSIENLQNSCNVEQFVFVTVNQISDQISQHIKSEHNNVKNNCALLESPSYDIINYTSDPQDILYKAARPHSVEVDNFQPSNPAIKNISSPVKCKNSKKHIKMKTAKHKLKFKNEANKNKWVNKKLTKVDQLEPENYECNICKKTFSKRCYIELHINCHLINEKKFECSFCMKKFKTKFHVRCHIVNIHIKEKIFVCDSCGSSFHNKRAFNYHTRTKHAEVLPFECEKCNKKFAVLSLLRSHVYNVHRKDKSQWVCDVCGKALANKNSLAKHKLRHEKTPEELQALKIYKCLVCDARYDHPCHLKYHMRMHTGEKLFVCKICKKSYTRKNGLDIHLLTHTGERQFVCDVCGKDFAIKKNLNDHKFIHTGIRRFQCNDCEKTYTQNSALNIHLKKTGHTRKRF